MNRCVFEKSAQTKVLNKTSKCFVAKDFTRVKYLYRDTLKDQFRACHNSQAKLSLWVWDSFFLLVSGDLNHTLYNGGEKSPKGFKRQNVWMRVWKCSICLILVMFVFFIHFQAVVYTQSVKGTKFWVYMFLQPKNQYGWYGEIGVWLYKWVYSLETVDFCWRKYIERM